MMIPASLWLIGGLIVIIWVAVVQMRTSAVRRRPLVAAVAARWVLLAYGLLLIALVLRSRQSWPGPATWTMLVALAALSVGLGIARGLATKVWVGKSGRAFRRGGAAVLVLWGVSLVVHLGIDWAIDQQVPGLGPTTVLAYVVATIAAQNITVRRRARALLRMEPH